MSTNTEQFKDVSSGVLSLILIGAAVVILAVALTGSLLAKALVAAYVLLP